MSRINTNIPALRAIQQLNANQSELALRLERLSTGLRINHGADDPAGLIASEALRSEIVGLEKAISNSSRAINVIATTEAALSETSRLLLEIRGLLNTSANEGAQSDSELRANQLQIDSLIESIDRIANTTQFNGKKLLNGELAYTVSGVATSALDRVQIFGARVPDGSTLPVVVQVTQSAQTATLTIAASAGTGLTAAGLISAGNNVTIELRGVGSTETLTFTSGTVNSAIRDQVNSFAAVTGVSATLSGQSIRFNSRDFGTDAFVSIRAINGVFNNAAGDQGDNEDRGRDVGATVNGINSSGDALQINLRTTNLDIVFDLNQDLATRQGSTTTFNITGGGATFAIGPVLNSDGLISLGVESVASSRLGNATDGILRSLTSGGTNTVLSGNFRTAERILLAAIDQVATLSGRLGGFQRNQLETNINSRRIALENVTAAQSAIRDADYAVEVSLLTRAQVLVQGNTLSLGIANQIPQNILALLQ